MSKSAAKFSVHLDSMRALAALTVFMLHGKGLFVGPLLRANGAGGAAASNLRELTNPAHQAVIVFFVLSGFFVGGGVLRTWKTRVWTWKVYAIQRLTRLWIVLIPALIFTLLLDTIGLHFFGLDGAYGRPHWESFINPAIVNTLNARTFFGCVFFLQTILVEPVGSNGALWTLAYEFWFYVAFPLVLGTFSSRFSWPVRMLNAALLIGAGFFVGWKISEYFLLWLLGAALQVTPKRLPTRVVRPSVLAGVMLLLGVSLALMSLQWNLFLADLIEAFTCALLCYAILHETGDARQDSAYVSASRRLSDMSYTLYLTHLPILTFICALLVFHGFRRGHDVKHIVIYALVSIATFALSYLSYLCFERHSDSVRRSLMSAFTSTRKLQTVETGVPS